MPVVAECNEGHGNKQAHWYPAVAKHLYGPLTCVIGEAEVQADR